MVHLKNRAPTGRARFSNSRVIATENRSTLPCRRSRATGRDLPTTTDGQHLEVRNRQQNQLRIFFTSAVVE